MLFRKKIEIVSIFLFGLFYLNTILYSQEVIDKKLNICYLYDINRSNILGIIRVEEDVQGVHLLGYFDTEIGMIDPCNKIIREKYPINTIIINNNRLYLYNEINCGVDISLCIPERLFSFEDVRGKFIVIELHNISYTTIGGGIIYHVIVLDSISNAIKYRFSMEQRNSLKPDQLIDKLTKLKLPFDCPKCLKYE